MKRYEYQNIVASNDHAILDELCAYWAEKGWRLAAVVNFGRDSVRTFWEREVPSVEGHPYR